MDLENKNNGKPTDAGSEGMLATFFSRLEGIALLKGLRSFREGMESFRAEIDVNGRKLCFSFEAKTSAVKGDCVYFSISYGEALVGVMLRNDFSFSWQGDENGRLWMAYRRIALTPDNAERILGIFADLAGSVTDRTAAGEKLVRNLRPDAYSAEWIRCWAEEVTQARRRVLDESFGRGTRGKNASSVTDRADFPIEDTFREFMEGNAAFVDVPDETFAFYQIQLINGKLHGHIPSSMGTLMDEDVEKLTNIIREDVRSLSTQGKVERILRYKKRGIAFKLEVMYLYAEMPVNNVSGTYILIWCLLNGECFELICEWRNLSDSIKRELVRMMMSAKLYGKTDGLTESFGRGSRGKNGGDTINANLFRLDSSDADAFLGTFTDTIADMFGAERVEDSSELLAEGIGPNDKVKDGTLPLGMYYEYNGRAIRGVRVWRDYRAANGAYVRPVLCIVPFADSADGNCPRYYIYFSIFMKRCVENPSGRKRYAHACSALMLLSQERDAWVPLDRLSRPISVPSSETLDNGLFPMFLRIFDNDALLEKCSEFDLSVRKYYLADGKEHESKELTRSLIAEMPTLSSSLSESFARGSRGKKGDDVVDGVGFRFDSGDVGAFEAVMDTVAERLGAAEVKMHNGIFMPRDCRITYLSQDYENAPDTFFEKDGTADSDVLSYTFWRKYVYDDFTTVMLRMACEVNTRAVGASPKGPTYNISCDVKGCWYKDGKRTLNSFGQVTNGDLENSKEFTFLGEHGWVRITYPYGVLPSGRELDEGLVPALMSFIGNKALADKLAAVRPNRFGGHSSYSNAEMTKILSTMLPSFDVGKSRLDESFGRGSMGKKVAQGKGMPLCLDSGDIPSFDRMMAAVASRYGTECVDFTTDDVSQFFSYVPITGTDAEPEPGVFLSKDFGAYGDVYIFLRRFVYDDAAVVLNFSISAFEDNGKVVYDIVCHVSAAWRKCAGLPWYNSTGRPNFVSASTAGLHLDNRGQWRTDDDCGFAHSGRMLDEGLLSLMVEYLEDKPLADAIAAMAPPKWGCDNNYHDYDAMTELFSEMVPKIKTVNPLDESFGRGSRSKKGADVAEVGVLNIKTTDELWDFLADCCESHGYCRHGKSALEDTLSVHEMTSPGGLWYTYRVEKDDFAFFVFGYIGHVDGKERAFRLSKTIQKTRKGGFRYDTNIIYYAYDSSAPRTVVTLAEAKFIEAVAMDSSGGWLSVLTDDCNLSMENVVSYVVPDLLRTMEAVEDGDRFYAAIIDKIQKKGNLLEKAMDFDRKIKLTESFGRGSMAKKGTDAAREGKDIIEAMFYNFDGTAEELCELLYKFLKGRLPVEEISPDVSFDHLPSGLWIQRRHPTNISLMFKKGKVSESDYCSASASITFDSRDNEVNAMLLAMLGKDYGDGKLTAILQDLDTGIGWRSLNAVLMTDFGAGLEKTFEIHTVIFQILDALMFISSGEDFIGELVDRHKESGDTWRDFDQNVLADCLNDHFAESGR